VAVRSPADAAKQRDNAGLRSAPWPASLGYTTLSLEGNMKKLFISADIEGTAGIAHWDETEYGKKDYNYFREQMSREVAAACEGALAAGVGEILIKDAHDGGRNIVPTMLPQNGSVKIFRSSAKHPYIMMAGLDESFEGIVFTGYHSGAEMPFNPLSHTMTGRANHVLLNGELCSELMLNSLTAAMLGVPVYCVTGDKGLCDWIQSVNPNIQTVPVSEGHGNGSISIHPIVAVQRIRETVQNIFSQPHIYKEKKDFMYPLPEHFVLEINYKQHFDALNASWYPGCVQTGARSVRFESDSYMDVLQCVYWIL
jgi:D-amino peptidase